MNFQVRNKVTNITSNDYIGVGSKDIIIEDIRVESESINFEVESTNMEVDDSANNITSVGTEIFPLVDQKISEFLTPQIISAERTEMAQCLYYDATLVDLTMIHSDNDNEDENVDDKFIEDVYDARQALLKSLITEVDQENIQEIWLLTDKRPGNNRRKHFIIVMDPVSYLCTCMSNVLRDILCRHYFQVMLVSHVAGFHIKMIASRWYCDSKKEMTNNLNVIFVNEHAVPVRRSKYGKLWGLAQQATQLVVECNDNEMSQWLKTFIDQKKRLLASNNEDETNEPDSGNNAKKNLEIANPPVTKHKGRSANK
ncbi:6830_t:CDS:2 [Dentiscutata erythropus]|uniref:6830_t:CDS:1 n=1 Tax=Dentiscutata erythropus TaxID=1348616 RepID=A0A9N9B7U6_9GLOM|nr:6830_t:CDS:2 [Dentiscutata erythropus]